MIRALARWLQGWRDLRVHEGKLRDEPEDRTLGRLQMRVAQAHADYQSAKQTWPRDRKAIDRAWRQFRDARCEQISAEIGQDFSPSRDHARSLRGVG